MNCGAAIDECTGLDRDVAHGRLPAVRGVRRRGDPDLRATAIQRCPRERHPVLPADETADPAGGRIDNLQVVACTDSVEEALVVGRHQLAVPGEKAARPENEKRVVERPGSFRLALVDADCADHVVAATCFGELVHERPGHVDRAGPHPVPELVEPERSVHLGGSGGPRVGRVERDEGLRQHGQLCARGGDIAEQADRFRNRGLGVEDHRGRLNGGDPNGGERGHALLSGEACASLRA